MTEVRRDSISIGRIQYINVDPVYYGFKQYAARLSINLISSPPSILNQLMADGRLDISSVSSSAYARNWKDWLILPDLSISCYGKVMSVLAASRYPLEELGGKKVLLTDESATAVDLLKLLFAKKNIRPDFHKEKITSPSQLRDTADAGLIIGDCALKHDWRHHFEYVWDLCELWNQMTGLPFVFGIWVVRKAFAANYAEITSEILDALYRSRMNGLANISAIMESAARKLNIPPEICKAYYDCMSYNLGAPEYRALETFFKGLHEYQIIDQRPELNIFSHQTAAQASIVSM
ncbi:MAG: menaquinone biosynthesis protein [Desulfobacterales bacterium]|nr:menaquinone biosynthesis protein [Desulfobacterales bacterium]